MKQELILYPGFALMFLTLVVLGLLAFRRLSAITSKEVNPRYFKLLQGYDVPDALMAVSRNYQNLMELPIIFYALIFSIYLLGVADWFYVNLSWAFVVLRYLHSYFHIFGNPVQIRFFIFATGYLMIAIIFIRLMAGILF